MYELNSEILCPKDLKFQVSGDHVVVDFKWVLFSLMVKLFILRDR